MTSIPSTNADASPTTWPTSSATPSAPRGVEAGSTTAPSASTIASGTSSVTPPASIMPRSDG
ncbi:hypothetical protein CG51_06935 [Haematobacter missouriensis]|nr:hypothetical protein CG51_06935 [Haematobacter missouriensis]